MTVNSKLSVQSYTAVILMDAVISSAFVIPEHLVTKKKSPQSDIFTSLITKVPIWDKNSCANPKMGLM
ncbi:hypothetical protein SES60163_04443 [Salmonella enterica subsp. salamae serovar 58:l,z13,z28:z6 str. 00-0163]|nr:hypothetical protein SES60163_04443 [Salmonella enterica subsp. salamae serovar 58:l,z13,z28:z6 str. 00-0163]